MQSMMSRRDLVEALHFYAEAGLDVALDEKAQDRFVPGNAKKDIAVSTGPAAPDRTGALPAAAPGQRPAAVPDSEAVFLATRLAQSCDTIEILVETMRGFDGCGLKFTAKNPVFCDGNPLAKVMFISDVPGKDDDLEGRLLSGPAGLLFDRMLASINLDRTSIYVANLIPWRPPGNRAPTAFETSVCLPFIRRHVELAAPDLLVLAGELSAKALLKTGESILRLRGQWRDYALPDGRTLPALSVLHPAYLIRQVGQKRLAWADLLELKSRIASLA